MIRIINNSPMVHDPLSYSRVVLGVLYYAYTKIPLLSLVVLILTYTNLCLLLPFVFELLMEKDGWVVG